MTEHRFTESQLREGYNLLQYDIAMLVSLTNALQTGAFGYGSVGNAVLESILLHARILIDFMYNAPSERYPDDIVAEDYFADPSQWRNLRPARSALLTETRRRVGSQVAHLTMAIVGVADAERQWQFGAITQELNQLVELFQNHHDKR